jgi:RimJ/RimL family protein N-acetyltransferase
VRRDADDRSVAFLYAMWVAPEARGGGAARALCDACAAWAAQRGCTTLRLAVFAANPAARRAYAAAGFAVCGRADVTTPDGRVRDELRMARAL